MKRSRVLLPLALLLLPACGSEGGGSDVDPAAAPAPITGSSPLPPAPEAPGASAQAPAAGASTAASAGAARSASPAAAVTRPRTSTADPATPAPAAARTAAPAAPASRATRAGRYTYDSSGTFTAGAAPRTVSGTSTLSVDPPTGDRQTAVLEGEQGRTETETVLRADGRYLSRLLLTTPAFSKEFVAAPPVLLVPEGAPAGRTWTFTVKSTDGKTTGTARNRVLRAEKVTVGGRSVDTRVIETVLALRGDVTYDGTTTSNYAPAQRLAVKERGTGRGTVSGVPFSAETRSSLRSLDPA